MPLFILYCTYLYFVTFYFITHSSLIVRRLCMFLQDGWRWGKYRILFRPVTIYFSRLIGHACQWFKRIIFHQILRNLFIYVNNNVPSSPKFGNKANSNICHFVLASKFVSLTLIRRMCLFEFSSKPPNK